MIDMCAAWSGRDAIDKRYLLKLPFRFGHNYLPAFGVLILINYKFFTFRVGEVKASIFLKTINVDQLPIQIDRTFQNSSQIIDPLPQQADNFRSETLNTKFLEIGNEGDLGVILSLVDDGFGSAHFIHIIFPFDF